MPCNPVDLGKVDLFKLLDGDELAEFAAVIDTEDVAAGETLFTVGAKGECLYIVKSGEVELFIKDTAGQKITLKIAEPGDLFGEISMLDNRPRTGTAIALLDTEVFVLDRSDLLLLFQKHPDSGLNMLAAICQMLREADNLLRTRVSKNVNDEVEEKLTPLQRISDGIAWFSGSMYFLFLNGLWFFLWIAFNTLPLGIEQFDPFPFGLLTMIVSLEAIFLSCFVLVSQNRQSEKDRIRSDIEYDINVKAEMEITHMHEKLDHVYEQMLDRFSNLEKEIDK